MITEIEFASKYLGQSVKHVDRLILRMSLHFQLGPGRFMQRSFKKGFDFEVYFGTEPN